MNSTPAKPRHRQDVQGHDAAGVTQALAHHLRPAAGRRAQIHHGHAGLEQAVAVDQLLELEHRARTPAFGLGAFDERIREMLFEPEGAGFATRHAAPRIAAWPHDTLCTSQPHNKLLVIPQGLPESSRQGWQNWMQSRYGIHAVWFPAIHAGMTAMGFS
jgi:hypothetical protein